MTTLVRDRVAEHRLAECWLARLRAEAEREIARRGGFGGRVRPAQRRWSRALDAIEQAEHEVAA